MLMNGIFGGLFFRFIYNSAFNFTRRINWLVIFCFQRRDYDPASKKKQIIVPTVSIRNFRETLTYFQDDPNFGNFWSIPFTSDARKSCLTENAGGHSQLSEMLSIHYFGTFYGATDFFFEMQVEYWIQYKMIDFSCLIGDERYGISVTRAMGYPDASCFTDSRATELLEKKLYGLVVARNSVIKTQRFFRSILHIWCQSTAIAEKMKKAYSRLNIDDWEIRGSLILLCTVYEDEEIYSRDKYSYVERKKLIENC